jgi:hypothetical protein
VREVARESRLTSEGLEWMNIGGRTLVELEKLFVNILFDYEGAVTFDNAR